MEENLQASRSSRRTVTKKMILYGASNRSESKLSRSQRHLSTIVNLPDTRPGHMHGEDVSAVPLHIDLIDVQPGNQVDHVLLVGQGRMRQKLSTALRA